jgi:hypothetical protein
MNYKAVKEFYCLYIPDSSKKGLPVSVAGGDQLAVVTILRSGKGENGEAISVMERPRIYDWEVPVTILREPESNMIFPGGSRWLIGLNLWIFGT